MKRLIAILNDGFSLNIEAEQLRREDNFFIAENKGELVAAIDCAAVVCIYLSTPK